MTSTAAATSASSESQATAAESDPRPVKHNAALGYLRGFVVLLVVAHHACLAYFPFVPPPPKSLLAQPRLWGAFPVVDSHRWIGFAFFAGFNDTFFMSLMFLLSGLFVANSLQRKGAGKFLRDRVIRLAIPFAVAAAVIAPLAYYPTYLTTGAGWTLAGFWRQWLALGYWPA